MVEAVAVVVEASLGIIVFCREAMAEEAGVFCREAMAEEAGASAGPGDEPAEGIV